MTANKVTTALPPRRHVDARHQPDGTLCTRYDGMEKHYCHCPGRVSHRTLPVEAETESDFDIPTSFAPDEVTPAPMPNDYPSSYPDF